MPDILQYLLKLSVSLALVYGFYRFILRPLTFYTWNRWFLLVYSAIAFVIPFININPILAKGELADNNVVHMIPVIDPDMLKNAGWLNLNDFRTWVILLIICGTLFMLARLIIQLYSYRRLKKASTLIASDPVMLYQVDKDIVPFSFGNAIFLNQQQHSESELREIIHHEFVHVKQRHTADMLWAEVLCILNWYNPFAWLIKKVIGQNLEFIADAQVLQNGIDPKEYQYLLLKVAGGASYRITNQFNLSFLKKRILMMNKMKSAKYHMVRFLFILPLLAVLLLSFREKIGGLIEGEVGSELGEVRGQVLEVAITGTAADTLPEKPGNVLGVVVRPVDSSATTIRLPDSATEVLYIVDEMVRDRSFIRALDPETIATVDVLKGERTLQYGDKGKNGVVRIRTKSADLVEKPDTEGDKKQHNGNFKNADARKKDLAWGKEVPAITTVKLKLDSSNGKKYGFGSITSDSMTIVASQYKFDHNGKPKPVTMGAMGKPLFIVDGVRLGRRGDIELPEAEEIERIEVLKSKSATALYGEEGSDGVIIVTSKKQKNKPATLQLKIDSTSEKRSID